MVGDDRNYRLGYGDKFPVTTEGRMVAMFLMCAGVGLFGILPGLFSLLVLAPSSGAASTEVIALWKEIAELKAASGI